MALQPNSAVYATVTGEYLQHEAKTDCPLQEGSLGLYAFSSELVQEVLRVGLPGL